MWQPIVAGVIATLTMDVLSAAAMRLRISAPLQPNLIGRWFASVARAQPFHADIARSAPGSHELAIAVCTSVLPWLVMFPSMGYGLFGVNGPPGTQLFVSSLINHLLFGVGIWVAVRALQLR